jgi:glutathione S-transferase
MKHRLRAMVARPRHVRVSLVKATLYTFELSHPGHAVRIALELTDIEYRVVDLLPGFHPALLRVAGFRGGTVPALRIDGRRVQHSVATMRLLDRLGADPPLYPSDPVRRRLVAEAEEWGEREVQPLPRRVLRWSIWHNPALRVWMARQARLPAPELIAPMNLPLAMYFANKVGADDSGVRTDLQQLPGLIDRVDELIAAEVIGGEVPNAADLQIGTSLRVMLAAEDLRPYVEGRPAAELARRILPDYPGPIQPALPPEWLRAAA